MNPKRRLKSRGAAMVEAGAIAPIFAMMFVANVWLAGVYQAKIISAQKSRAAAFYSAGNNCDNKEATAAGTDPTANSSGGTNGTPTTGQAGLSTSLFITHAKDTESFSNPFTYNSDWQSKSVTSESAVMCNEKPNGFNPLSYIGQMISQGFGGH